MRSGRPTLVVRADASVSIGTGHVVRCVALGQCWQDRGGDVVFAMRESFPAIDEYLRSENIVVRHQESFSKQQDVIDLIEIANEQAVVWVVVDGYQFDSEYQRMIKGSGLRPLFIDDDGVGTEYFADVLLNQNPLASERMYVGAESRTRLLLGPRFALLRRDFVRWREWKREQAALGTKVLVTMGGSDSGNVTGAVIEALGLLKTGFEARVIVGGGNPHKEILQQSVAASAASRRIELIHNPSSMAEQMVWADVAVAASGSTCWEMCLLGLPAILIGCAPNQCLLAEELERLGCAEYLGAVHEISATKISSKLESLLRSQTNRDSISRRARQMVDGRGAERVVGELLRNDDQMLGLHPAAASYEH